jgi:predicted alpha-1,2-mannosidase
MLITRLLIRSLSALVLVPLFFGCQADTEPADYVDPFIGTGGHGHTFPGATLPFGMVQLSPDTRKDSWDGCSGYHYSDNTIIGFSHTHLSGTGVGDYGDIRLMPMTGKLITVPGKEEDPSSGYRSRFSHNNETASPGYYSVLLADYDIKAELTVTERSGFHRYTFNRNSDSFILIDLFEGITSDKVLGSSVGFIGDTVITGYRRTKGWAEDQHVYFYAVFSRPFASSGIESEGRQVGNSETANGTNLKAWAGFNLKAGDQVLVKVGISAVDVEGARNNLNAENPGWDFDAVKMAARSRWNEELSRIFVQSDNKKDHKVFYTALYHTMIAPNLFSDVDGRYRGHDKLIHRSPGGRRYTVFSLWDTFRTLHPLFNLIQRDRNSEMIRSMLDIYDKGGLLPVWELAGNETWCMIGYHSVPVIVDAWACSNRDFDAALALEAMVKSATRDHHGLKWYKSEGYIPANMESESVSKTLEYAYDDWCIARMAAFAGNDSLEKVFSHRALSYMNLYDPSTRFFRGRQNGGFIEPFDPTQVNFMLTEANSWQYNFFVPQDINGHIALMGGPEKYEEMLDGLFHSTEGLSGRKQSDITGLIGQYAHGNEPSHHMAYLYNFVGKPKKTQEMVKKIMDELYTDKPDGLSGNEDCGQMSAWYVMSALGMYPVSPGSGYLVLGLPRFSQASVYVNSSTSFRIKANNLSPKNRYVQSVKLNGEPYMMSYLPIETVLQGGELVFQMGASPFSEWGTTADHRPIQKIDAEGFTPVAWIQANSKTFTDSLLVSMGHVYEGAIIYYTTDGSKPDTSAKLYTQPLVIRNSGNIRAVAFHKGFASKTSQAEFFRIPAGRSIELFTAFNAQYPAGGNIALIDNQRGSQDFRTGSWQGYHGADIVAVVDLGKLQPVNKLEMGFLQDIKSWIFMPLWVQWELSVDGQSFEAVGKQFNTIPAKAEGAIVKSYGQEVKGKLARYVRVTAKNRGVCPDWHLGKGEPAWVFADEIIIE